MPILARSVTKLALGENIVGLLTQTCVWRRSRSNVAGSVFNACEIHSERHSDSFWTPRNREVVPGELRSFDVQVA